MNYAGTHSLKWQSVDNVYIIYKGYNSHYHTHFS